jgi:hypothetical protein
LATDVRRGAKGNSPVNVHHDESIDSDEYNGSADVRTAHVLSPKQKKKVSMKETNSVYIHRLYTCTDGPFLMSPRNMATQSQHSLPSREAIVDSGVVSWELLLPELISCPESMKGTCSNML